MKRSKVIFAASALVLATFAFAAGVGRTELVSVDLSKRTATVVWTWTDLADNAVRLSMTRNGEDFPTAGWGGTLFVGDGALGCAVAGTPSGYNELFFDVGRENVPTNGKYAVQIVATNAEGRVEEWARGTLTVRANPAADGMPTNWSAYADIARKVAPYIDAQGILSDPANADALWGAVSNRTDALVAGDLSFELGRFAATGTVKKARSAQTATTADDATRAQTATFAYNMYDSNWLSWRVQDILNAATNGAVARATTYGTPTRWTDATGCVWEVGQVIGPWSFSGDSMPLGVTYSVQIVGEPPTFTYLLLKDDSLFTTTSGEDDEPMSIRFVGIDYDAPEPSEFEIVASRSYQSGTNLVGLVALTNDIPATFEEIDPTVPSWAKASSKPHYSAGEVGAYPDSDGETLANIVNSWEGYWGGTNVIFEVTNYYGNTSGEFPRLRIKELRADTWHVVWDEATKFDVCASQIVEVVAASNTALKAEVAAGFAPKAWGAFTDKGQTNVVGNSVWMTSPETYFAGGTEYQRVAVGAGVVCVLTENGAAAYSAGEAGTFRFQDEGGTNYFGFVKSDSYTIGCRTDGIAVDGNLVTLRYDVIMGGTDVPVVYWRLALDSGEWVQLNNVDGTACDGAPYTVTWYTSGGSYYAAINCGANGSGFFKAETSVAGDVVFETNMKVRLGGGIECTNTASHVNGVVRPKFNGTSVTWEWSAR